MLISLRNNNLRFFELRDSIQGISEKMLAQTLRALVQDGLVWREVEPTTPPQVTYGVTEFGQEVAEPLTDLFDRITRRLPPRDRAHRPGGSPIPSSRLAVEASPLEAHSPLSQPHT